MAEALTPRPAATIALVREARPGFEVLMLKRNLNSGFVAGAHVFPGGAVDAEDDIDAAHALCSNVTDAQASARLSLERGGLAYFVAAIRECFEEAGLLFAYAANGTMLTLDDDEVAQRYTGYRHAMHERRETFVGMCAQERLCLAADQLTYFGHWITPVGAPRRYDTRFFFAIAPQGQSPLHDDHETIAHDWLKPLDALERHQRGEIKMRGPTVKTLEMFARADSIAALCTALRTKSDIQAIQPVFSRRGWLIPGDPGYDEALARGEGEWK